MSPDAKGNFKGIVVPRLPESMELRRQAERYRVDLEGLRDDWTMEGIATAHPLDTAESVQADQETSGPGWPE